MDVAENHKPSTDREYIEGFLADVEKISREVSRDDIERVIQTLFEAWKENRQVFVMGNGGSASTATHLVSDLVKTINDKPGARGIRAMALVDNIPLASAITNDRGWENLYVSQLETFYQRGDVGIGISVHGGSGKDIGGQWSQNLLKGLQFIKDRGGRTIGLSGFDGGPMAKLVDAPVVVRADSTPLVEGFHVVLHHLIVFRLKELIANEAGHLS
ncbi:MAG: Sedoheptulose 7-phosphate isomerase [Parcubacteria group bacterium GW2011_GWC2_52_8c]|nr:MAG: Sedoheptulose 7-phosphate isomerase [Parcubacteria group bacterium GW2011_GWA1_51_12]KKW31128.1 MAG: Sedoheptulose 7-phosphate isomerase [Parcubacteria group bacterium GW2011_GWC2_52_8c]